MQCTTQSQHEVFECIRHQMKREVSSDMAMRSALQAAFRTTEHNFFQYANRLEAGPAAAWANAGSAKSLQWPTLETAARFWEERTGKDAERCGKPFGVTDRLCRRTVSLPTILTATDSKDCRAVRLSEDHTPDVPGERKRIEAEGAAGS
eukprot:Skav221539  [mRNA]  locus=scaffold1813:135775:139250:+ [translate_table: standard]